MKPFLSNFSSVLPNPFWWPQSFQEMKSKAQSELGILSLRMLTANYTLEALKNENKGIKRSQARFHEEGEKGKES